MSTSLPPPSPFNWNAVGLGLVIGTILCFTNTYFGLQSGWISMMSLQASLLGSGLSRLFKIRLSIHDLVLLQTTAVASGTLPLAAGLIGVIPALSLLSSREDGSPPIILNFLQLLGWSLGVAFFGCFLAVPLRKQVIVKEKLVFPSGSATAHVIGMLYNVKIKQDLSRDPSSEGYSAIPEEESDSGEHELHPNSWKYLARSFIVSAGYTLLSLAFPVFYAMPLFDIIVPSAAHTWLWWFTPSFSYIGQGIIMGFPTTASMSAGMLVGWAFLSPLSKHLGWAPGAVSDTITGARGWIMWPALSIMIVESIMSLVTMILLNMMKESVGSDEEAAPIISGAPRDVSEDKAHEPNREVVYYGFAASVLFCVIVVRIVFGEGGMKWWITVLAVGCACVLSILGVRALGQTDLNPVSSIAKITQLLFAVLQPHHITTNLLAGAISEAGAQQAGDLMQDLKTGHLIGSSPKVLFGGQIIGSAFGAGAGALVYWIYRRVYELPGREFPVPMAGIWLNLARLVNDGQLPERSKEAMVLFGTIFVVLNLWKSLEGRSSNRLARAAKWIPSGIAFSIGFINTPSFSLARLIGGVISLYFSRRNQSNSPNLNLIIIASGFVLGEGMASIVGLVLKSLGVEPLSCGGCGVGGGGYCSGC